MSPFVRFAALAFVLLAGLLVWSLVTSRPAPRIDEVAPAPTPEATTPAAVPSGPTEKQVALGRLATRTYTDQDGLPQNTVVSMAFDAKGYLWIGTYDGAARYNGNGWTRVDMPNRTLSNDVRAILPAADGGLWFGTFNGGLHRFDGERWTTLLAGASPLPDNQVRGLLESALPDGQRAIWIATLGGIARFDGTNWTVYGTEEGLPSAEVWGLIEAPGAGGSTLWAATSAGIARLEAGRWVPDETGPRTQVNCLLTTRDDGRSTLLAGTESDGLWVRDGDAWRRFDTSDGLASNSINCLFESLALDGGRAILAGTTAGLARYEGERWATQAVAGKNVRSIAESAVARGPSALWLGTDGDGLAVIRAGQWRTIDSALGLGNDRVSCLLETKNERGDSVYWIGTDGGGLSRFENGRVEVLDTRSGFPSNDVATLLETVSENGARTLWVGTDSIGLIRVEGGRYTLYDRASGLPDLRIWSLLETTTPEGGRTLWAGLYGGGLARFENGRWTAYGIEDGLPNDRIWSLLETTAADGGRTLWVGTAGGGLARLRDGRWRVYDTSAGLPNNGVWCLHESVGPHGRRALWIGTDGGGVARLDLGTEGVEADPPALTVFSDASVPALPNNIVYGVQEDAAGRLYLFTNRGVARLTPRNATAEDPSEYAIHTFTTEDGLPSNECTIGASYVDSLGRVWAGTILGAAVLDPSLEIPDLEPKPLYVERATIDGRPSALVPGESLSYDENRLLFSYALLSYHRGGDTRFRTQLVGFDPAPSSWSRDAKREFTALPDGDYTFHVWGRDYAGNVSGPVEMAFSIRPAPWRTWWAWLLYAGLIGGLVIAGVRLRLRALEHRNTQLESGIAERTAELAEAVEQLKVSQREALEAADRARASEQDALDAAARAHESEQRALEANRAKSVFLANISHELRTPLNAILGFPQIMSADENLSPEHRETLAVITRAGEHLLGLINDVLSISKIESGKVTVSARPFDLMRLLQALEEMIRVRADGKGLQFLVDLSPEVPRYVEGDEGKLRQVLINLLGNAVKFTDEGGIALRTTYHDGRVLFEVEDTGHGIAPEELDKLFQPFVQTESGRKSTDGTGLGLAISQNFVTLMGGTIAVRSTLGRGTVFSFDLPMPVVDGLGEAPEPRRVVRLAPDDPMWRLVVADDKPENRALIVSMLRRVGLDVREAANGREAVELWRTWHPHLIWMDVRMPVMDGLEATREIRRLEAAAGGSGAGADRSASAIIALTASVFENDRDDILAAGCDDFVPKPFREATIFEKMAEHLGMHFEYEAGPALVAETWEPGAGLAAARFAGLPKELLGALRASMEAGDVERAIEAIDRIADRDAQLAAEIRVLVRAYRFDEVQRAVEAALADAVV